MKETVVFGPCDKFTAELKVSILQNANITSAKFSEFSPKKHKIEIINDYQSNGFVVTVNNASYEKAKEILEAKSTAKSKKSLLKIILFVFIGVIGFALLGLLYHYILTLFN